MTYIHESRQAMAKNNATLKNKLDDVLLQYHQERWIKEDPLWFPLQFTDLLEREFVALLSAQLAYGSVKVIKKSIQNALSLILQIEPAGPKIWVQKMESQKWVHLNLKHFREFKHRFNSGADLIALAKLTQLSWKKHHSIGAQFCENLKSQSAQQVPQIRLQNSIDHWINQWKKEVLHFDFAKDSLRFFLTQPEQGSACKRQCMFLRWMGRKDQIDPGDWIKHGLESSFLIIPLDVHLSRISYSWGMTQSKTAHWKGALEVTERLKKYDPVDPIKYDFALCRLGMFGG